MILMISLDGEVKIGALFRLLERRINAVEFERSNRIKIPLSKVLYVLNRIFKNSPEWPFGDSF